MNNTPNDKEGEGSNPPHKNQKEEEEKQRRIGIMASTKEERIQTK